MYPWMYPKITSSIFPIQLAHLENGDHPYATAYALIVTTVEFVTINQVFVSVRRGSVDRHANQVNHWIQVHT